MTAFIYFICDRYPYPAPPSHLAPHYMAAAETRYDLLPHQTLYPRAPVGKSASSAKLDKKNTKDLSIMKELEKAKKDIEAKKEAAASSSTAKKD